MLDRQRRLTHVRHVPGTCLTPVAEVRRNLRYSRLVTDWNARPAPVGPSRWGFPVLSQWPPQDVIAYAAKLMGIQSPTEEAFETAEMSAMARSFYAGNARVSNARAKRELGVVFAYPTYRHGLDALWDAGEGR